MTLERDTTTDDLTAEELEILEFMLKNKRQGQSAEAKIGACDHSKDAALSFGQLRSWMQHELNKGQSSSYDTLCLNLRLRGKLNIDAMQRSLTEIVRRHEILRTTFKLQDAGPVQVVGEVDPVFEHEDLSDLVHAERESRLTELLRKARNTLFNLEQDALLQTRLIRLAEADHVLNLTMHHIIFDEWSKGILLRELGLLYPAFDGQQQSPLPELPIQYRDFSVWQHDWLQGEVLQEHLDYWTQKLAGLPTLALPTDYPRPQQQTFNGAYESLTLSREISDALNALSKQHGVTLYITMLSVLGVLLHRYCGQDDVSIGTVITNRDRHELNDLIGFFLNTLVMRLNLSGEPSFAEYLERVKDTTMGAFAHQHLPFDRLVEEMHPQRETNRNPLFQVSLTMLDAPAASPLRIKDLELTPISGMGFDSLFDLDAFVNESPAGLVLSFAYNTDLFAASTVGRMLQHYKELLQAVVTDASSPVSRLPMLTRSEYDQIVSGWNQTRKDYVKNETLHSLFEQQVQRSPQATAVSFEQQSLDYAGLDKKANDVACLLLAKNIKPGQLVGVYLERSIDLVAALLGILKAGAAYVPLDPEYPTERIDYIVADSNISVLLSQNKFETRLPKDVSNVILLDQIDAGDVVESPSLPAVTNDMLAYVIYTSGSTGNPKGVMVSHAAVVNHACWMQDLFKFDQADRLLQRSPIGFDASVCEIFMPLLHGACVVLSSPSGDKDIDHLIQEIQDNKVTTLILVPSALRILLQNLTDPAALSSLKRMGCGGEALTQDLKQAYYGKCSAPLYNLYGPTESTVDATSFLCEVDFAGDNIPIGNPISNKRAYILDRRLQPVPIGVHGELHIGGAGLARGYLNRSELTAEKFIADPFSDDPEARLYKTGDVARYREDGSIEYIGRIDHQVKIRGFRIELDEIEVVLSQHDFINDCAAVMYEDVGGFNNLAAYFVSDSSVSTLSLRNYLRKKLPHYMIPTLLTKLDEIPVTPNGKVDHKTLVSYAEGKNTGDSVYQPPRTPAEKTIAGIWETLLHLDRIGVGDNFIDIGGHSLLLIQARSEIQKVMGVAIPVADFFHQTLGQIATYCENNQAPEMSMEET